MYSNSVPVFKQFLMALKTILAQADAHAGSKSMEPDALLQSRLYPDMFPLLKQVQIAADFSRGISARLAGVEVPSYEGKEKSFADLDALLASSLEFLDSVTSPQFEGSETKEIVLRPGTPKEKKLSGQAYLANYGLPQFFFHVATAYDILRHNGLAIGKRDYMGAYWIIRLLGEGRGPDEDSACRDTTPAVGAAVVRRRLGPAEEPPIYLKSAVLANCMFVIPLRCAEASTLAATS